MNQTTKETRRRSYDAVLPKRAARCRLILETLGNRELTASEITEDDQKKAEKDLQDLLDKNIKRADAALAAKEKELMAI